MHEKIIVSDSGGKYTQLIARKVRESEVYSEVIPFSKINRNLQEKPLGIIFSGDKEVLGDFNIPTLYLNDKTIAEDFEKFENDILNFLKECNASFDWKISDITGELIRKTKEKVGDKSVLLALSGGVDSSVLCALLEKAAGDKLTVVFVDTGLMRKNEGNEVEHAFKNKSLHFVRVNAKNRFLNALAGVTDPEQKRKIIGELYIRVFEEEAKKFGKVDFLAQGTIYPDVIESGVDGKLVKSHHNVGGLPDYIDFNGLIEPLRYLFKNEVRALGKELGLPEEIVKRQPFPGPGLGIRVIGEITEEKLDILREADWIFRTELENNMEKLPNQYFTILTNMRTVGVSKDERTYAYTLALRAVRTIDFMSAETVHIPYEILEKASSRIINEVPHVNRVVYDITNKPPATIEWE